MDFLKCKFCKLSHNHGRKHLYSDNHKKKVKFVYRKFKRKVKSAKEDLGNICIESEDFENCKTFWCFFCEEECLKHLHSNGATVKSWSFIQHVCQESHLANVNKFWKEQRIKEQSTNNYCISPEEFETFKIQAVEKLQQHLLENGQCLKEKVNTLKAQEQTRRNNTIVANEESYSKHALKVCHEEEGASNIKGIRTIAAKAEGLTCISIPIVDKNKGNIHTGATPPWLRNDNEAKDTVGPSFEDYKKHLEYERKKKLPPGRVGATNNETDYGQHWMPSFGRVWSKNSRQNQRKWSMKQGYMMDRTRTKAVNNTATVKQIEPQNYSYDGSNHSYKYPNINNEDHSTKQVTNCTVQDNEQTNNYYQEKFMNTEINTNITTKEIHQSDDSDFLPNKVAKYSRKESTNDVKPYTSNAKMNGTSYHRKSDANNLTKQRIVIASNLL